MLASSYYYYCCCCCCCCYCTTTVACYFASDTGSKYCDQHVCMFVWLFVCLYARIIRKPHVQISPNFFYTLPVSVARSSSDGSAICYVLPVLLLTPCFHIMEAMGQNRRQRTVSSRSLCVWRRRGRSCCLRLQARFYVKFQNGKPC